MSAPDDLSAQQRIDALHAEVQRLTAERTDLQERNNRQAEAIIDEAKAGGSWRYPHMCRDEHVEIGHADNSSEMCPLCRVVAERDAQVREAFIAGRTGTFYYVGHLWEAGKVGKTDEFAFTAYLASRAVDPVSKETS